MSEDWRNEPATEEQKGKLRFFGCTWDDGITAGQANDALEDCARQFPDAEADYQKSQPATEMQKEKLRFFGCTWNGEITVGKASEALGECERQFPDTEAIWQLQKRKWVKIPGTFPVKEFDQLDKTTSQEVTIQKAEAIASQPAAARSVETPLQYLERTGRANDPAWQRWANAKQPPLSYDEARAMTREGWNNWIALHGSYGTEQGHKLTYGEARALSEKAWIEWRVQHRRLSPKEIVERQKKEAAASPPAAMWCSECRKSNIVEHNGQHWCPDCGRFVTPLDAEIAVRLNLQIPSTQEIVQRAAAESKTGLSQSQKEWDEWFALKKRAMEWQNPSNKTPSEEVTIQEAAKPQNSSPQEIIPEPPKDFRQPYEMFCPACDGQIEVPSGTVGKKRACPHCQSEITPVFTRKNPRKKIASAHVVTGSTQRPAIQKPVTYKITTPIEQFAKWVDRLLERNNTCLGGHWLPAGPLKYAFDQNTYLPFTIGLSRQIADTIESKGYCVEPDARFGSGSYEWDQTLALFKPFDNDPIQPSTAYLGAANLLRLCVLIATADGRIDLVELDVFREAIENHIGLSLTDHKRLLILEQLLAQELCSASKTAATIAKSVPPFKRLVIGKLLVEVAAANNFITNEERRVLEQIFKSFEIPPETLEKLIAQICPSQWPRHDSVKSDVSKNDRWLWNHWRTGHPGVVIDDTTLDKKTWNFNDWKALNARWRDLHEKLAARQKQPRSAPERSSQEAAAKSGSEQVSIKGSWLKVFQSAGRMLGTSSKKIPEPVAAPVPNDFTLDMARVYEITSETKEVVAILSVLMEDEPEKSIAPSAITLPAPEIPKFSGDGKIAPQPTRFNGLDAAFHPILERLLARDSWPKNDFKSLADEFHFMPSKIHDTLNEWADEVLGDFILDGEDPVVIRRELITKEKVYG